MPRPQLTVRGTMIAVAGALGGAGTLGGFAPAVMANPLARAGTALAGRAGFLGRAAQGAVTQTPGVAMRGAAGSVGNGLRALTGRIGLGAPGAAGAEGAAGAAAGAEGVAGSAAPAASAGVKGLVGRIAGPAKLVGGLTASSAITTGAVVGGSKALEGAPQWSKHDMDDFRDKPARQAALTTAFQMKNKGDYGPMDRFLVGTIEQRAPYMAQQAGVDAGEYKDALAKMTSNDRLAEARKWNPDLDAHLKQLEAQGGPGPVAAASAEFGKLPQWAQMVLGMGLPLGLVAMAGTAGAFPMLLAALGLGAGAYGLSQGEGGAAQPQQPAQPGVEGAGDNPLADLDTAVNARLGDHNAFGDVVQKYTGMPRFMAHAARGLAPDWTNQQIDQNAVKAIETQMDVSPDTAAQIWVDRVNRGAAARAQAQADTQARVQQAQGM